MRTGLLAAAAAVVISTVAGCGDSYVTYTTPTATPTLLPTLTTNVAPIGSQPPTASHSAAASAPTTPPSRAPATVDAAAYGLTDAPGALSRRYAFQSPSGNISCGLAVDGGENTVACELDHTTMTRPELQSCVGQFSAWLADGKPSFACMPANQYVGGRTLPYGSTINAGETNCTSLESGMRCESRGHGFTVAGDAASMF